MSDVTRLLDAVGRAESRERGSAEELLPLVYDELRRLAAAKMAKEKPGQTLQPTALVHEVWLRLLGPGHEPRAWNGRSHFFGAAAEAMRRILVDQARRKSALKRGEALQSETLDDSQIELKVPADEFMAVNDAMDQLAAEDELAAEVVKLRYFVGMTNTEVAEAIGISPRSVDRHWAYARAWLKGAIKS